MVSAITISIDGQEIVTQPGKTIIQAAQESGLYILSLLLPGHETLRRM